MNENVLKVDVDCSSLDEGALEQLKEKAFVDFDCLGVNYFSMNEAEVDELLGERAYSGGDLPLSLLLEVEKSAEKEGNLSFFFKSFNEKEDKLFDGLNYSVTEVENEDWNENWKKTFSRIVVGEDLIIVPDWEKRENKKSEVYIYPGMGFGTGGHETTFLCLSEYLKLEKFLKEEDLCLDFGCGSGILGISALKRKKMICDFIDIDSDALDNCLHNLNLNDYSHYKEGHLLALRERFKPRSYKLIFANILENILEKEAIFLINCLSQEGYLILSGLLLNQIESIKHVYSELELLNEEVKGDWAALTFKK